MQRVPRRWRIDGRALTNPCLWAPESHVRQIRISGSGLLSVRPVKMTRTQVAVKMTGTLHSRGP